MTISNNGLNHLKSYEQFRSLAYDDLQPNEKITSASQIKGTLTIGYGHTKNVKVGQKITEKEALYLLDVDSTEAQNGLKKYTKVPLTQNMYDALTSFIFNVGVGAYADSTLLKKLNAKDYLGASNQFGVWIKSKGKVLEGLKKRRDHEKNMFLNGISVLNYFNPSDLTAEKKNGSFKLWYLLPILLIL